MKNITAVILNKTLEQSLVEASRRRQPHEVCGVIFGTVQNNTLIADGFSLLRNVSAASITSFAFHPEDWIAAYYGAQKNQREIVGFFHSHPQGSLAPSVSDELGYVPWGTYWIVGLTRDQFELAVYVRDSADGWIALPIHQESYGQCRLK
ncbi:M67 family metallopeptidase [Cohnella mopanensis]|uniref:M67 family metallopeptidase n=1 Tax=Cohnella mopanensis TaxID=2911966 RepID=UPI001EF7D382|nr:M67 family metallopeptidase [Cohnella mopanensis]